MNTKRKKMTEGMENSARARNEYELADKYAKKANREAGNARDLIPVWLDQKDRLDNWKRIMSMTAVPILTVVFLIVCVAEYFFSREIYRDISRNYPWAIALGFVAVAILISELLVYKLSPSKQRLMFYEYRRDRNLADETDESIGEHVKRKTNRFAVIGGVLAVVMLAGLYYLSHLRVEKEILIGSRESGFGVQDLMPVILYIAEIISGVFVWYLIRRVWLGWKVKRLERKAKHHVNKCAEFTTKAVQQFADAESRGYSVLRDPVSDDIHEAFYRHDQRDTREMEKYVSTCELCREEVTLVVLGRYEKPLRTNISIVTDFKFSAATATDKNGRAHFEVDVYPGDTIRSIYIEKEDSRGNNKIVQHTGPFQFGREHTILSRH